MAAKRTIRSKPVRHFLTFAHDRCKPFLQQKAQAYGKRVLDVCEAYTSKIYPETGELHKIGNAKRIRLTKSHGSIVIKSACGIVCSAPW
jgi:putative transposase